MEPQEIGLDRERIEANRHTIELKGGGSITVEEIKPGEFKIVSNSMTRENSMFTGPNLAYSEWDGEVKNLDTGLTESNEASLGLSLHLQWEDVELMPDTIKAPSLIRLQEALKHVDMKAYDPGDV